MSGIQSWHKVFAGAMITLAPCAVFSQGISTVMSPSETTRSLTGRLLDENGKPLAKKRIDYRVTAPAKITQTGGTPITEPQPMSSLGQGRTDEDGNFKLILTGQGGEALLTCLDDDYAMLCEAVKYPADNVELKMRRPYTKVSGLIKRLDNGAPVENAIVTVAPQRETVWIPETNAKTPEFGRSIRLTTDASGKYETDVLPAGEVIINAITKDGLQMVPPEKSMYTIANINSDSPTQIPDISLYPGYTIKGKVTDSQTKNPIVGVQVGFMSEGSLLGGIPTKPVISDAEGNYILPNVTPFRFKKGNEFHFTMLEARANGYRQKIENPVVLSFDKDYLTVTQDFELTKQ